MTRKSTGNSKKAHSTVLKKPGYHLRSTYDLKRTRHIIEEKRQARATFSLNLAPMVDMFSILVIYLLMNFSTSGEAFFISKEVTIPKAAAGRPMESFPLVSLVRDRVYFESEGSDWGGAKYLEEQNDGINQKLRRMLRKVKDTEVNIGGKSAFRGQINLQADEKTPVDQVKRLMRVLIEEGWGSINFIVEPKNKK